MTTRIFVSHSHQDDDDTKQLVDDLRAAGADVWVDVADLQHGDFMQRINQALGNCQWVVLVQTPSALRSSYVQAEVNAALKLVIEKRIYAVIPFIVKPCDINDVPAMWSTLHYYDATQNYQAALAGLLNALGLAALPQPPINPLPLIVPLAQSTIESSTLPTSKVEAEIFQPNISFVPAMTTPLTQEQEESTSQAEIPTSPFPIETKLTSRRRRVPLIIAGVALAVCVGLLGIIGGISNYNYIQQQNSLHYQATASIQEATDTAQYLINATSTAQAGATATVVVQATATVIARVTPNYVAAIPGPCDKGKGEWSYSNAVVTCSNNQMHLVQGTNTNQISEEFFYGTPNISPTTDESVSVDVSAITDKVCSGVLLRADSHRKYFGGYNFEICANGNWDIVTYDSDTGNPTNLDSGSINQQPTYTLRAWVDNSSLGIAVNDQVVDVISNTIYTSGDFIELGIDNGIAAGSADFKNFTYTALP